MNLLTNVIETLSDDVRVISCFKTNEFSQIQYQRIYSKLNDIITDYVRINTIYRSI